MPKDVKKSISRKDFLATATVAAAGGGLMLAPAGRALARERGQQKETRWGFLIDLRKCKGCNTCQVACKTEFDVRLGVFRSGVLHHDSGAYPNVERTFVPWLCNHCDKPPCAQVCPVQATYKRHDGIVIVDHHRCIGCRYCVIACPYNARYFNFRESEEWPNKDYPRRSHGVAEACTLCAHRLERGAKPACVEACEKVGAGALVVGDLNDPESDVSQLIASRAVRRIREDLGTEPKVYYIGL